MIFELYTYMSQQKKLPFRGSFRIINFQTINIQLDRKQLQQGMQSQIVYMQY
jgi:hypothetical protein